jgi:hypothetical protein
LPFETALVECDHLSFHFDVFFSLAIIHHANPAPPESVAVNDSPLNCVLP